MFVIGEYTDTCEVFDNNCKTFVAIKSPFYFGTNNAFSVGNKIVIILNNKLFVLCYDVDNDKWSKDPCEATNHLWDFSCVKIPSINKMYNFY